jgi:hypothetical protein
MGSLNKTTAVWRAILFVVLIYSGYVVVSAVIVKQATGILKITASPKSADISISANDHNASFVGNGSARVRIAPGTYYLFATDSGRLTYETVKISKKQVTSVTLDLSKITGTPSVDKVNFENMGSLIDHGISSDQIKSIEAYIFQYKRSAKNVVVDPNSIQRLPPDPASGEFTVNFNVKIDGSTYSAKLSYSDIEAVRLYLYNSTGGAQVFDSQTPVSQTSE